MTKMSALIVDDAPVVRAVLRARLEKAGVEVIEGLRRKRGGSIRSGEVA
jgi:CheY-like chemotaxis protein